MVVEQTFGGVQNFLFPDAFGGQASRSCSFGSLPQLRANDDFLFVVVTQDPVSIESYPTKHTGHAGLLLGLMSPFFDGEPMSCVY